MKRIIVLFFLTSNLSLVLLSQPKLNQVELIKQFRGTWRSEIGTDTIVIGQNRLFGNGLECEIQIITKGKVLDSVKQIFGYDKKSDKYIIAELIKSSPVIELTTTWFTSKSTGEMILLKDTADPAKAAIRWKFEFKSPDSIIQSAIVNDKVVKEVVSTRATSDYYWVPPSRSKVP